MTERVFSPISTFLHSAIFPVRAVLLRFAIRQSLHARQTGNGQAAAQNANAVRTSEAVCQGPPRHFFVLNAIALGSG